MTEETQNDEGYEPDTYWSDIRDRILFHVLVEIRLAGRAASRGDETRVREELAKVGRLADLAHTLPLLKGVTREDLVFLVPLKDEFGRASRTVQLVAEAVN